jgi:LysR family nitrogen assimilation transcriptional regulator
MNLRALSNFLSVAAAGSLQGAAGVVHIAQPALTRQIAMLEEEFGTRLFLRHHRGVTLTEAGEQLREHAERILAEVAKARLAMSTAAEQPTGTVSLGLPTAMRSVLSSTIVSAYHKAYPNVQLNVHEAFVHIIEDFLQMRRVDVGIVFDRARKFDNFDVTPLVTEDIYLAGPPDAGLDQNRPVSIKELAKVPVILLSKRNQLYQAAKQAMAQFNCDFRPFLEVEGEPLTIDLVKKGVGYTIRPFCAVQNEVEAEEISVAPIRGLTITWALGVNRVRAHTPAVRELVALIREAVDDRIANGTWRTARPSRVGSSKASRRTRIPALVGTSSRRAIKSPKSST